MAERNSGSSGTPSSSAVSSSSATQARRCLREVAAQVPRHHVRVAAVLLGVGRRAAEHFGEEQRDVVRMVAAHVGEDGRQDGVVLDAVVEAGGEAVEHRLAADPLVEGRAWRLSLISRV